MTSLMVSVKYLQATLFTKLQDFTPFFQLFGQIISEFTYFEPIIIPTGWALCFYRI